MQKLKLNQSEKIIQIQSCWKTNNDKMPTQNDDDNCKLDYEDMNCNSSKLPITDEVKVTNVFESEMS